MLDERETTAAIGTTAYDASGEKIGTVEHFYVDDRTGAPSWVAVTTGLSGTRQSVVPALDATFTDGGLRLPVAADAVASAPHLAGDHLTPEDEAELRRHYEAGTPASGSDGGPRRPAADAGSMTRSEEQLVVDTERVAVTRARLVKYVVTEEVTLTVPVRREEIRLEHVPIDAPDEVNRGENLLADRSAGTTGSAGLPDEIILHTERPVVTVEVVPTERVRLRTELVEGRESVTEQVQREQIVVDEDSSPRHT